MSKRDQMKAAVIIEDRDGNKHHFKSLYEASKIMRVNYGNLRRSKSLGRGIVDGLRVTFL